MGERGKQTNIYFAKFMRLFISTGGWKVFIFAGIISGLIAWVVGANMFQTTSTNDTEAGCFAIISACIWIGIFNSIQEICKERDIIKREHRSGLHISSYIFARARYELIICAVQAIIIVIICGIFMDFPGDGLLTPSFALDAYLIFFACLLSADYLGIAISCIVKTTTTAMTVMPFVLIIQLVLSGFVFKLEDGADIVAGLTVSKWGMKALGAASDCSRICGFTQQDYPYKAGEVGISLLVLVLFSVLYLAIGILFLKRVDKDKR